MIIRLKSEEQIKVFSSADLYSIMQRVLMREHKIDRNREHLWTISLDMAHRILNIELVSMGSVSKTITEPMEVFSVPLQKRAVKIVLVHNHPSGELQPSQADKDITDRLIQCGLILNVPLLDHLIITEKQYYSFADSGLLTQLEGSNKYVPEYRLKEQMNMQIAEEVRKKEGERKSCEMARVMKQNGEPLEKIMQYTGLSRQTINGIKLKSEDS